VVEAAGVVELLEAEAEMVEAVVAAELTESISDCAFIERVLIGGVPLGDASAGTETVLESSSGTGTDTVEEGSGRSIS